MAFLVKRNEVWLHKRVFCGAIMKSDQSLTLLNHNNVNDHIHH